MQADETTQYMKKIEARRENGKMRALIVWENSGMTVEDVLRVAYSEGKKLLHTYESVDVLWLQFIEKIGAWVVVVGLNEEVVEKKLGVSERISARY